MAQSYSFKPLQLRPISGIDISEFGIEETHLPYTSEKSSTSTITQLPDYDPEEFKTQPSFGTSSTAYDPTANAFPPFQEAFIPSSVLEPKKKRFRTTWAIAILSVIVTAFTIWYSYRVMVDQNSLPSILQRQPGSTVLVVNVLSHAVAFLCWALFTDTMEALRWALACRPEGVLLTSFLAMSRATPMAGVTYLCLSNGSHRIWALQRIFCHMAISVLGLVLISNVTFRTIYTPYSDSDVATSATQPVIAGLYPVSSYGLAEVPLAVVNAFGAYSISFITDPRFVTPVDPVQCNSTECLSIFLPGGMDAVQYDDGTGNNTLFNGRFGGDYSTIVTNQAPGYQIEYGPIELAQSGFEFNQSTDCRMYLQSIGDGLFICKAVKGLQLFLGWTVCPGDNWLAGDCQSNLTWTETINWNTTVSMYSRKATVAYNTQNVSILNVESISQPIPYPVPVSVFEQYCDLVLGSVATTLNMSANATEYENAATSFDVEYSISFLLRLYESYYTTLQDGGLSLLQSFVAVPFQFSTALQQMGAASATPKDNHVTASLSKSSYRAIIDLWTVCTFGVLASFLTAWGLGCLCWLTFYAPSSPNRSLFPEIDITSKASMQFVGQSTDDLARMTRSYGLGNGMSKSVIKAIKGKRVYCGACTGMLGEKVILLVMEQERVRILSQREKYT